MNARAVIVGIGALLMIVLSRNSVSRLVQLARERGDDFGKLHPEVQWRTVELIERMNAWLKANGYDYEVALFDGHRDVSDQLQAMDRGASWLSDPLNGYHPWGLAVDIVFKKNGSWTWLEVDGKPGPDFDLWYELGRQGEAFGFEWGGRWRNFDGPHFQFATVRVADLKNRYGRPDDYFAAVQAGNA